MFHINNKILVAAEKSNRKFEDITLVGVTKTIDVPQIQTLIECGISNIGENKVQELISKYDKIENAHWHMIGHLQTNKVKYIIDKVNLIHSVDNLKLGKEISKRAKNADKVVKILVEINIGNEPTKSGILPEDTLQLITELSQLENIIISGLMCVAPYVTNPNQNRDLFKRMNDIFINIASTMNNNINTTLFNKEIGNYSPVDIQILSMGMTSDYEVAIEEGATMVRIGTGLFGKRNY